LKTVDLNADVGEGFDDEPLFAFVTSVNLACGAHAGDEDTMRRTIAAAHRCGLAIGAHPGWDDREHFGRRELDLPVAAIEELVAGQVCRLAAIAAPEGVRLTHVKPHGALYNQAARDRAIAAAIARAIVRVDATLVLVGLAGSVLLAAAKHSGLRTAGEGFVDRGYRADGSLAPRDLPGAVTHEPGVAARRAVALARGEEVESIDGARIQVNAETLCLHGDTPGAASIARAVRAALARAGIAVRPLSE
jgi:UPF0271 protein